MISSLQRELDDFFAEILDTKEAPTTGAFSKARKKLRHTAFIELNDLAVSLFYRTCPVIRRWLGLIITAADGTSLALPRTKELANAFGGMQPRQGKFRPKARVLERYDVLNHICWQAIIAPYKKGERALLDQHLEWVEHSGPDLRREEVLTLYDRGFASFRLLAWHDRSGSPFVLRLSASWWHMARNFLAGGASEERITFKVKTREFVLRLVRVDLPDADPVVLVTNLLDSDRFPASCFGQLYHLRWGAETGYRLQKSAARLENWSGKSEEAIRQDFHAKIFSITLASALSAPEAESIERESEQKRQNGQIKHSRQINRTHALGGLRRFVAKLLSATGEMLHKVCAQFIRMIRQCLSIIRPGREAPRPKRPKPPPAMAYKVI